jgi:hypothetical protein
MNEPDLQSLAYKIRDKTERFIPSDTFFIFMKADILYFDNEKQTWDFGDTTGFDVNLPLMLPENASMVRLDNSVCEHSDIIITGGVDKYNNVLNWTMGLAFSKEK